MCYWRAFCIPFLPAGNRVVQECTQGFESLSLRQTKQIPIRVSVLFFGIKRGRAWKGAKNYAGMIEKDSLKYYDISINNQINPIKGAGIMRIKTAIAWIAVLMLIMSSVGCSQPAVEESVVTDVIPEVTVEPTATPEPTPVPTPTPLPERGQLEGADILAEALAELGYDDIRLEKN